MNELVFTYEALKDDRDAQQKRADALAVENNKLCKKLTHAEGCFKAAIFEGLDEALVESAGSNLADIVSRRIVHAFPSIGEPTPATDAALTAIEARSITAALDSCSEYLDTDCVMDMLGISYPDAELRTSGAMEPCDALKSRAAKLREAK